MLLFSGDYLYYICPAITCQTEAHKKTLPHHCDSVLFAISKESGLGFLGQLSQLSERLGVVHSQVGQHLAVDLNALLLQAVDQGGIVHAVQTSGSVDAGDPQGAELALTQLAAGVSIAQGAANLLAGSAILLGLRAKVALRQLEHLTTLLMVKVDYAGAYITLEFDKVKNSETYVCFNDMLVKDVQLDIYVESEEDISRIVRVKPVVNRHYYGQREYTAHVEYSEEGHDSIRIRFMYVGEFECSGIDVYSYEMDNFSKYTQNLSEDTLENINISQNTITGDITVDKEKILCLAVPYMDGWTVKVDGVETPYYQANVMHLAIELEPGTHHIEYSYETPGLKFGIILSIVGFIGFAGVIVLVNRRKEASIH